MTIAGRPSVVRAAALIVVLVVYGNAKSWWDLVVLQSTAAGSTFAIGAGIALVLAILLVTVLRGPDPSRLGLAGGDWRGSLRVGVWIGGTAALVGGALILGGGLAARSLNVQLAEVTPAATAPWGPLLWRALLLLWVDTAVPEELAFRGALLLALGGGRARGLPPNALSYRRVWPALWHASLQPAVIVSSVAFAAWHIVVVIQDGTPDVLTVAGKLAIIAVGGLLFGALRLVGGNLLAPIVGHWLFDMAAMITARLAVAL